MEISNTLFCT